MFNKLTLNKKVAQIIPLALVLFGLVGYNYMNAEWTAPPPGTVPPANNTPAPIHVGPATQTKLGTLNANNLFGTNGVVANRISLGTCAVYGTCLYPHETIQLGSEYNLRFNFGTDERALLSNTGVLSLKGDSQINSGKYCDENGANCFDAEGVGSVPNIDYGTLVDSGWNEGSRTSGGSRPYTKDISFGKTFTKTPSLSYSPYASNSVYSNCSPAVSSVTKTGFQLRYWSESGFPCGTSNTGRVFGSWIAIE